MAAGLAALGDDHIDAGRRYRPRVLDCRHHGDHLDAALVTAVHDLGARVAQPDAEDRRALLQEHLDLRRNEVRDGRRSSALHGQPEVGAEPVQYSLHGGEPLV